LSDYFRDSPIADLRDLVSAERRTVSGSLTTRALSKPDAHPGHLIVIKGGMAKLVVIQGQTQQREVLLGDLTLLGRSPECQLVISGPLVSRLHARIGRADGDYYIEDLGSANGTTVNGRPVTRTDLRDGDWITVGECQLTFLVDDGFTPPQEALLLDDVMATIVGAVEIGAPEKAGDAERSPLAQKLQARLQVVREVAERSCGALEVGRLLELTLLELLRVYRQADHAHGVLLHFGPAGEDLRLSVAQAGQTPATAGMSRTLFEIATTQRKAVLAADTLADARLESAQSIVGQNLRSMMCSPLAVGSRVLGAIQVDTTSSTQPFDMDDLELLVTVAGQVAVAAENSRLHARAAAQERLAAVGQAVAGVAHCIKNTLNGLQGGAYIVDLGIRDHDAEKTSKGWDMVKRNAGFMSDLVRDMLMYCRMAPLQLEPTDVRELLKETLLIVQESASQKGIEASLATEGELPPLAVDPTSIKRAVLNLLTNAIDACSQGCHVKVSVGPAAGGAAVQIAVADDGPGMPAGVRERLFEPFFTTKGSRGTGLGLPLVRKIVEEHHGRVEVSSVPGAGTTFCISIPVSADEKETVLG